LNKKFPKVFPINAVNPCPFDESIACASRRKLVEYPEVTPSHIHVFKQRDVADSTLGTEACTRRFIGLIPQSLEAIRCLDPRERLVQQHYKCKRQFFNASMHLRMRRYQFGKVIQTVLKR
jgi:hypothetical protein